MKLRRPHLAALALALALAAAAPAAPPDEATARVAERYKEILRRQPAEGAVLDRLWKLAGEKGFTAELLREFESSEKLTDLLLLGHLRRKAGQPDLARAAFRRAGEVAPKDARPRLALAALENDAGEFAAAATAWEQAAALLGTDPAAAEAWLKAGQAWQSARESEKAAAAWEKAAAVEPGNPALRLQFAQALEKAGQLDRTAAELEKVVALETLPPADRLGALRELARVQLARDDFDAAVSALDRALALLGPDHWARPELQRQLVRLYQRSGRVEELEASWTREAEGRPRDRAALLRLVELYGETGDADRQAQWLEKLLALTPRDRDLRQRLARLQADRGETAAAAALYDPLLREAPAGRPPPAGLVFARAELDLRLDHPADAAARVQAALAAAPGDESLRAAALAFFQRNRFDAEAEGILRGDRDRAPQGEEPAVALAGWLFAQKRTPAALEALDRWTAPLPGEASPARAARLARAADLLRTQGLAAPALERLREAVKLDPAPPFARRLALADALLAAGDEAAARSALEEAAAAAQNETDLGEADDKFYNLLQAAGATKMSPAVAAAASAGRAPVPARDNPAVRDFLRQLAPAAKTPAEHLRLARFQLRAGAPEEAIETAVRGLRRGGEDSVPLREFLARVAADTGRRAQAVAQLEKLAELVPAQRWAYRRRAALLRLDEPGRGDEGLAALRAILEANPGSPEAMADLAGALSRLNRWYDAAQAWEKAVALAPTARARAELRAPLLAALEKTGRAPRAAEVLAAAVDEEADPARRLEVFRDLLSFCQRQNLLSWLEEWCAAKLRAAPQDWAAQRAQAELRRAQGREAEAYALQRRAAFSAPDPAAALQELARLAEELGDAPGAASHQRRLVRLPGQGTPENYERLAALEETALEADAAARTWDALLARFPRDSAALGRAADHFQKNGDRAHERAILAQLAALDPTDLPRLLRLGSLQLEAGDRAAARRAWETLLEHSEPEPASAPLRLPVAVPEERRFVTGAPPSLGSPAMPRPGAVRLLRPAPRPIGPALASGRAAEAPAGADATARLDAVRELARLHFPVPPNGASRSSTTSTTSSAHPPSDPAALAWLERLRAAADRAPSEALAACFHAGRFDLALDLLAERLRQRPDEELAARGFAVVALHGAQWARLAAWMTGPSRLASSAGDAAPSDGEDPPAAARRALVVDALEFWLQARAGESAPAGLVDALFPPGSVPRTLLWNDLATRIFAAQHRYAEAVAAGRRFLALTPANRAPYAVEVAKWLLSLDDAAGARATLRSALDGRNAADHPDASFFEALRLLWELSPAGERPALAGELRRRAEEAGGPGAAAWTGALLAGWQEDGDAARADLDRWLALRPALTRSNDSGSFSGEATPAARQWSSTLTAGARLEQWGLPDLARHLWRRALTDSALVALRTRGDDRSPDLARQVRQRLLLSELAGAAPGEAETRLSEWFASRPPAEEIAALAGALASRQLHGLSARVREEAAAREPGNADHRRAQVNALRAAGDIPALREAFERLLHSPRPLPAGMSRREVAMQLVELEEKMGNPAAARALIEEHLRQSPRETYARFRYAQSLERSGQLDDALAQFREIALGPSDFPAAVSAAASLLERRGHPDEAAALLEAALGRPSAASQDHGARLAALRLKAGQTEAAKALAQGMLKGGQFAWLPRVADAFAAAGEKAFALDLLRTGVQKCREAPLRLNLQQALLERHLDPAADPAGFARELRRLGETAAADPKLRPGVWNTRLALARRFGLLAELERDLRAEWRDGAGDAQAGVFLARVLTASAAEGTRLISGSPAERVAETVRAAFAPAPRPAAEPRAAELRVLLDQFLARRDAVGPSPESAAQPLWQVHEILLRGGLARLAAEAAAPLARRFAHNPAFALGRATGLLRAGARDEAAALLGEMENRWLVLPAMPLQVAAAWQDAGEPGAAADTLERAARRGLLAERADGLFLLARLRADQGDLPGARRWMREGYQSPSARDVLPLVSFLARDDVRGLEEPPGQVAGDYGLRPELRRQLPAALAERLASLDRGLAVVHALEGQPAALWEIPSASTSLADGPETAEEFAAAELLMDRALLAAPETAGRLRQAAARLRVRHASLALSAGRADEALRLLAQARRDCRWDWTSARRLAQLHLARGERAAAAAALEEFIAAREAPTLDRESAQALLARWQQPSGPTAAFKP